MTGAGIGVSTRPDFTRVTEAPSDRATADQLRMLYTRYRLAADLAIGRNVLEVACGSGVGVGLLEARAARVVTGDIDGNNCRIVVETYAGRPGISVTQFDAQAIPFGVGSFDLLILFEALYYLADAEAFFGEAYRVLSDEGILVISMVNCEWVGFNASPYSMHYFTAAELQEALAGNGYQARLYAGFPDEGSRPADRLVRAIRQQAVRLRLIPKTMKKKEWLKRLFYGRLEPIPRELRDNCVSCETLEQISGDSDTRRFRMIYAIATKATPAQDTAWLPATRSSMGVAG